MTRKIQAPLWTKVHENLINLKGMAVYSDDLPDGVDVMNCCVRMG